jgi:hypothetical protein
MGTGPGVTARPANESSKQETLCIDCDMVQELFHKPASLIGFSWLMSLSGIGHISFPIVQFMPIWKSYCAGTL